jgi:hypothetical protein
MIDYQLLTLSDYIDYFEDLTDRSAFIDRMYYGFNEFQEGIKRDKINNYCLVLEPYENQFSENQNDNILSNRRGFFVVLKPYTSKMGRGLSEVQNDCELICYKLIGQIKRDSRAWILKAPVSNWKGHEVEPVAGNFAGYMMGIHL